MFGPALMAALAAVTALALLSGYLTYRFRKEADREAARARKRSEAAFRRSGHVPDRVLCCGEAHRQVCLLADRAGGILRIEAPGVGLRRDIRFRELLGFQLLGNGTPLDQAGILAGPAAGPAAAADLSAPPERLQLMLYLTDPLEPALGVDLLLSSADRPLRGGPQRTVFVRESLELLREILKQARPGPSGP